MLPSQTLYDETTSYECMFFICIGPTFHIHMMFSRLKWWIDCRVGRKETLAAIFLHLEIWIYIKKENSIMHFSYCQQIPRKKQNQQLIDLCNYCLCSQPLLHLFFSLSKAPLLSKTPRRAAEQCKHSQKGLGLRKKDTNNNKKNLLKQFYFPLCVSHWILSPLSKSFNSNNLRRKNALTLH